MAYFNQGYQYHYFTKEECSDEDIIENHLHGRTVQQEFYRHSALFMYCLFTGKPIESELIEWRERLRAISNVKFSLRKQLWWFIKHVGGEINDKIKMLFRKNNYKNAH